MDCKFLWLAGLAESRYSVFFEKRPSVSPLKLSNANSRQLLLSDRNNFHENDTWGGWSNHAGGNIKVRELKDFVKELKGGNRVSADGHGEWVRADVMGANGNKPTDTTDGSRFSHLGMTTRPYYW